VTRGTIAIHGLGLIGGSLGLALRATASSPRVVGFDADRTAAEEALEGGAVEALLGAAEDAVPGIEIRVTAVPPRAALALVPKLLASLPEGACLTDLSSVMLPVLTAVGSGASGRFVGSHPLRGSEQGGFRAARRDLFQGATVLMGGPLGEGSPAARIATMWRSIGAVPTPIAPTLHDALVALTSHVPLVASSALVRTLRRTGSMTALLAQGAGPGLRDTTRLAGSPADLWFDILTLNAEKVTPALELLEREVRGLRQAIERKDPELRTLLEEARSFRREIVP